MSTLPSSDLVSGSPGASPPTRARRSPVLVLLGSRFGPFIGVGVVLLALVIYEIVTEPVFSSENNLTNLMRAGAIPLLLGAAMAIVLLTGGVDLSMGAVLALSGLLYAKLYTAGVAPVAALVLCLGFGALIGFVLNGALIGRLGMSFFVVTLGTQSALRGIDFLWSSNNTIDMSQDNLSAKIGNDAVFGGFVPIAMIIAVAAVGALYLVLRYTTFGRSVYAVGGNKEAAELSGVRSSWIVAAVYGISGLCAALAAVMTIGGSTVADPNAGTGIELQVAAAALLGGVALSGGVGSIWGAVLGTGFLVVLSNALALAGAPQSWQLIVTGVILVLAIYLDRVRNRVNRSSQ